MKKQLPGTPLASWFPIFLTAMFGLTVSSRAANLSVTPNTISNSYTGQITLQATGLTNGETVLLERFLDVNGNGVIDSSDWLVASSGITDGHVTSFGGVRDAYIPGDEDAVAGQVTTSFFLRYGPELSRLSGAHLIRLSSPTGRFTSVTKPLAVGQSTYAQGVSGSVTSGASPLPHAGVALLAIAGNDLVFVAGVLADASGNFAIKAAAGTYVLVAVQPGYVSGFGSTIITIDSNQALTQNLSMTAGVHVISGKVSDVSTGTGLPAVQLLLQSTSGLDALVFTDSGGNFSIPATADQWKFDLSDYSLIPLGYVRPQTKPKVSLGSADVTGIQIQLPKITALVYGTVKNDTNAPLAGITLSDSDNVGQYQSSGITDANGNYFLGLLGGQNWFVGPDNSQPGLAGYTVGSTNVTVPVGQALQVNFIAQRAGSHLTGHVLTGGGQPVAGITILAVPQTGGSSGASAVTGNDGSFDLVVPGGNWSIQLETTGAAARNLVGPALNVSIADGATISGINYIVQSVTASITGVVKDSSGNAIAGTFVFANVTVNGTNYNAAAQTDSNGNYSLGVFNAIWQVNLDCTALSSMGYGCPANQNATINGANATVNFTVPPPPSYTFFFRQFVFGGEFGNGTTAVASYPSLPGGYNAVIVAQNDVNYPPLGNVFFTGPPASGMNNAPTSIQNQDSSSASYISVRVNAPPSPLGGAWTVNYSGNIKTFTASDPQTATHLVLPVPSVTVASNILTQINWSYTDANGNAIVGAPAVVSSLQVQVFDGDLNLIDASDPLPAATKTYMPLSVIPWSTVGRIRMVYIDTLNNRYLVNFNRSAPGLATAGLGTNNHFQLQLTGLAGQNYTVQFSTTLTNWIPLLVTNAPSSSFLVVDPAAPGGKGFYRVLLGP